MPKNIIICSDGTGNEIEANLSNVLKLYRVLIKDDKQIVFYDPGMGTLGNLHAWSKLKQQAKQAFYCLTGANFDSTVLKAYKFLIKNYEPGDSIYLFGYSRGAYVVRVLAGFIHLIGLLRIEQENLCEHGFGAYKESSRKNDFKIAWRFKEVMNSRDIAIKFIGVWDTVSAVLVPTPAGIKQQTFPYTAMNPSVESFCQASALDERRTMFRLNRWRDPQSYNPSRFNRNTETPQYIKQVWFCGAHGDVGGGYKEEASGLAKMPLKWIIQEAQAKGLKINTSIYNHLVLGIPRAGSARSYVSPDAAAEIHNAIPWVYWWLCARI